jgi:hypothetical protein
MTFPSVVDELHLAELLRPLRLDFNVFDQAGLGRYGRLDARDDLVSREPWGGLIRMRHQRAPGGEQQRGAEAGKPRFGTTSMCHETPPMMDHGTLVFPFW